MTSTSPAPAPLLCCHHFSPAISPVSTPSDSRRYTMADFDETAVPANPMASLLELSHELLHCIFTEIEPADLAAVSQSCQALHGYIRGNRLLHKDLYIRRYDEPKKLKEEPDWETAVHRLVKMEKVLDSEDREVKRQHLGFVCEEADRLVETANTTQSMEDGEDGEGSRNVELLREKFADTDNVDAFLCASSLFARAGSDDQEPADTLELRQASAKLHCLYGVPIDVLPSRSFFSIMRNDAGIIRTPTAGPSAAALSTRSQARPLLTHTFARSKVYDLREYTEHTLWGPFMNDGRQRVDWEKVEAVMIVLGFNLRKFTDRSEGRFPMVWKDTWSGASPNSYKSLPRMAGAVKEPDDEMYKIRELALALDAQDPYGVSGSWMRVVCFLDYNDLYAFNFSERIPDEQPRDAIDTEEAIRLIRIKLQVTKIDPPGAGEEDDEGDGLDWSNFTGERLPVVHFRGTSRSLHASWDPNANSRIRGTVRQTPEGEIRWTTFSIFHGEERWRSEGIQVGGLRSARGVLGNWFDKDYDLHGPAGPTAFWKETDELEEEKSSRITWLPYGNNTNVYDDLIELADLLGIDLSDD
ncbi:hypothetical protein CLAFUR4_12648 [Fulvia fulva]|nr:hypothetical protein CLAFUR4_12648 [Fulvia fulva]KAK4618456.1 hypothetical protein CLAFUR0_12659 [Fulvia fulva]